MPHIRNKPTRLLGHLSKRNAYITLWCQQVANEKKGTKCARTGTWLHKRNAYVVLVKAVATKLQTSFDGTHSMH